MKIKKYDASKSFESVSPKIVKDYMDGYTNKEICIKYGISTDTLYRWKRLNAKFKKSCKEAERYAARSLIKSGLHDLAKGHEVIEEQTEYYDEIEDADGNIQKVKRIIRSRKLPPDIKAIRMLASKHAQGEYLENEANKLNLDIKITQKDRALSIEDRLAILNKDKSEGETVEDVEYKEL